MVAYLCADIDPVVTEEHVPKGFVLKAVDSAVLVVYAQRLWDQTIKPPRPSLQIPLRGYVLGSESTAVVFPVTHSRQ